MILTRSDGEALGETKQADMHRRGEILKTADADAVVSIHMNKFTDRRICGPMAYYQAGAEEGEKLAGCVINALTKALDKPERQPNPGNNFVTRIPAAPAVLVECGFLSNPEEELLLQQEAYQKILAQAIVEGLIAYFAEEKDA